MYMYSYNDGVYSSTEYAICIHTFCVHYLYHMCCVPHVLYATCTQCHMYSMPHVLYATRTLCHMYSMPHVLYATCTLCHTYSMPHVLCATHTLYHMYSVPHVLYATCNSMPHVLYATCTLCHMVCFRTSGWSVRGIGCTWRAFSVLQTFSVSFPMRLRCSSRWTNHGRRL